MESHVRGIVPALRWPSLAAAVLAMAMAARVAAQPAGYTVHVQAPSEISAGASAAVVFAFTVVDPAINSLTFTLAPPAGVIVAPPQQTSARNGAGIFPPLTFTISVAQNAPPGMYTIPVTMAVNNGARIDTNLLSFQVPSSDFAITVTPSSVALSAGETRTLAVSVTAPAFSAGRRAAAEVTVTVAAPSGVTVTPASFTIRVPGVQDVTVAVSPTVTGRIPLTFTASSGGIARVARAEVLVLPAVFTIVPSSVVAPSPASVLRVGGTNFSLNGTFVSASRDVVVHSTTVYNATLADVVVSVPEGAAAGPHRLDFRNADGAVTVRAGALFVVPAGDIGAPLGVTTAAIVFPVDGTVVGDGDSVYPRAMLATSGAGAISGTWSVDGVPFDRFTATASTSSVEVRTHVPIPPSKWGTHRVSLVIETPRLVEAPSVSYTAARESATRLSFYQPVERAVIENNAKIRWSLVPGATGYELDLRKVAADGKESGGARIRTTQTAWKPGDAITGMIRFRVRAIFPGDVRGEPTQWSTAVFLPRKASLHIDDAAAGRVAWSGGTPGTVYRIEFQRTGARCFDAVTFAPEYHVPGVEGRRCDAVRVVAVAPSGRVLGESDTRRLPAGFVPVPAALVVDSISRVEIVAQQPLGNTTVAARTPIAVRWRNGDERNAALLVDGVDVTPVAFREPDGIRYEGLLPLRPGRHVAVLAMPAGRSEWSFTAADEPPAPAAAATAPSPLYVVEPSGTVTWVNHPTGGHASEALVLSSKGEGGDVEAGSGTSVTGNLNYRGTNEPAQFAQASHDWIAEGRVMAEGGAHLSARLGMTTPDFTDAAKYLVSGTARVGVIARAGSELGSISYYQPIDPAGHGILSASPDDPHVRALALATPEGRPYIVRLIDVDLRERFDPLTGTGGFTSRTYGIFARYTLSPQAEVLGEVARGTLSAGNGSVVPSQGGNAAHFALSGIASATTYALNVSKVDPDFVTPANRVFTAGFNDRLDTELTLSRNFLKTAFSLAAGRYAQGRAHDAARGSKNTATLGMTAPLTVHLALQASAGFTHDAGEKTALFPVGTDRAESRASTTLTETFTRIALSQAVNWSRMNDAADPNNDVILHQIAVSANGAVLTNFVLTSSGGFTRTKASPLLGTTSKWTLSFAPSIAIPRMFLAVQPRVSIDHSAVDVTDSRMRSEVYETTLSWQPAWLLSFVSAQLSGTLTRTVIAAPVPSRTRSRAVIAAVTIRTKKTRGMPMFAEPPPLPGAVAPPPPEPASVAPEVMLPPQG